MMLSFPKPAVHVDPAETVSKPVSANSAAQISAPDAVCWKYPLFCAAQSSFSARREPENMMQY